MGMIFDETPIDLPASKIEGPVLTIVPTRRKINFNDEAVKKMSLVPGETFITVGYDTELKQMGFRFENEKKEHNSAIEMIDIEGKKKIHFMFIGDRIDKSTIINRKNSVKYPLLGSAETGFYLQLDEGVVVKTPSKKTK